MIRRFLSFMVLAWLLGFVWFAMVLPSPAGPVRTEGVVVLTGGEGRIARGLDALRAGWAERMLVSGVDREVRPREFQVEYKVSRKLMACCVTLGYESVDTRSNAREVAKWIAAGRLQSVRLVTTDWHMRRAALEISRQVPADVVLVRDSVTSHSALRVLFLEYNKWLARLLLWTWD